MAILRQNDPKINPSLASLLFDNPHITRRPLFATIVCPYYMIKYIIFFPTFFLGIPFLVFLFKKVPISIPIFFLSALFFTVAGVDINFISHETYRGTSRGISIGLYDIIFIALFIKVILFTPIKQISIFSSRQFFIHSFFRMVLDIPFQIRQSDLFQF